MPDSLPRNIDFFANEYRVRVRVGRRELRKSFATLEGAKAWRDRIRERHPDTRAFGYGARSGRGKASHSRVGVSRVEKIDRRKPDSPTYLVFSVNWKDHDGRNRVRSFQAGNVEVISRQEIAHAEKSAIAFREAYEYALRHGKRFEPGLFDSWRDIPCYPFRPSTSSAPSRAALLDSTAADTSAADTTAPDTVALNAEIRRLFGGSN